MLLMTKVLQESFEVGPLSKRNGIKVAAKVVVVNMCCKTREPYLGDIDIVYGYATR